MNSPKQKGGPEEDLSSFLFHSREISRAHERAMNAVLAVADGASLDEASERVRRLGNEGIGPLKTVLAEPADDCKRLAAAKILVALGEQAAREVFELAGSASAEDRLLAVKAISSAPPLTAAAVEALMRRMDDEDEIARAAAACLAETPDALLPSLASHLGCIPEERRYGLPFDLSDRGMAWIEALEEVLRTSNRGSECWNSAAHCLDLALRSEHELGAPAAGSQLDMLHRLMEETSQEKK